MKRIFLAVLASVLSLASYAGITVSVADINLPKGGSITFPISIQGDEVRKSFQTWITPSSSSLTFSPTGVTAGPIYNSPTISTSTDATANPFKIGCICSSAYTSSNGDLLYVTLNHVGSEAVGTTFTLTFTNFEMSDAVNPDIKPADVTCTVTITDGIVVDENQTFVPMTASGKKAQLIRSFTAGNFYTVCLPFTVAPSGPNTTALGGTFPTLYKYTGVTSEMNDTWDGTKSITINFTTATGAITANTPFLVKFNADCSNPTFTGCAFNTNSPVTSFSEPNMGALVDFVGTYAASKTLAAGDLYLKGGKLYSVPTTGTVAMKGTRAYFDLSGLAAAGVPLEVKMCVDGEETSIDAIDSDLKAEGWFDLNGRKLAEKPATKGVYISNGKKVVVK